MIIVRNFVGNRQSTLELNGFQTAPLPGGRHAQSFPPGLRELCSLLSVPPVPVAAIVVFLMRQERPDVDMPLRLPLVRRLRIVDDSYKPVPLVPNIKNDVAFYRIGIFERSADPIKIVPANRLDNEVAPG